MPPEPSKALSDHRAIELRIPCARKVYPLLLSGMPTRSIRLEEMGDGTHSLVVVGARGPLSDPFEGVQGLEGELDRLRAENERLDRAHRALLALARRRGIDQAAIDAAVASDERQQSDG